MFDPRRFTTVWAFTACYRDSFTFFFNFTFTTTFPSGSPKLNQNFSVDASFKFVLLKVTDKRQTRPLLREGAHMDSTVTVKLRPATHTISNRPLSGPTEIFAWLIPQWEWWNVIWCSGSIDFPNKDLLADYEYSRLQYTRSGSVWNFLSFILGTYIIIFLVISETCWVACFSCFFCN
jgi:hypothetical protein